MTGFRSALLAVTALAMVTGISSYAVADPVFTINPNSILGSGYTPQSATNFNGNTTALVQQTSPTVQFEQGILEAQSFTNSLTSTTLTIAQSGLDPYPNALSSTYDLFAIFTTQVTGISNFTSEGSILPGDFNFLLVAVPIATPGTIPDTVVGATANTSGGTNPTLNGYTPSQLLAMNNSSLLTNLGSTNVVLGEGTSIVTTDTGFQSNGAPIFSAIADLVLCTGTSGTGSLGGLSVAAAACGTFDARQYFTSPNPFFSISVAGVTEAGGNSASLGCLDSPGTPICDTGKDPNVKLFPTAKVGFAVPEPPTLILFGSALIALGALGRWRPRRKQQTKPA